MKGAPSGFNMKKTIALALAATACGAAMLMAADKKPAATAKEGALPTTGEAEPEVAKPKGPRYRVMAARGDGQKLEEALNKADADGYAVAGMNNEWVILERRDPPTRRRVVLPTTGQ